MEGRQNRSVGRIRRIAAGMGLAGLLWIGLIAMIFALNASRRPIPTPTPQIGLAATIPATAVPTVPLPATATASQTLSPAHSETPVPSALASKTPIPSNTPLAIFVAVQAPADSPTATASPPAPTTEPTYIIVTGAPEVLPVGTPCPHPEGWAAYTVEPGDTLFGFQLGADNQVDVKTIREANCLSGNFLQVGQVVFLPPGAGNNAPKVDESALEGDPGGLTRSANCPCAIRVRAGWRLEQIASAIDKLPVGFSGQDFMAATSPGASAPDYWFLRSRPAGKSLEGFMFPDTYTLENTTTAFQFRDMMLSRFGERVGQDLEGAAAARGMSFWELVNLASVVQRESYAPVEQVMIAGVMYNRINTGKGLASFVTLQYALGAPGNWWPAINKSNINTDTRYNTSKYRGLPPAPICSVSLEALASTAYPASHDYFYFNARCEGGGNFYARTYEEFVTGLKCD